MTHQLNPGSYELVQEGSVRGFGYVIEESPEVTVQRWLLLKDYVRPPKMRATFQPSASGWLSLEAWSTFVRGRWQPGDRYAKAICTKYPSINSYRDPDQQLDGGSAVAHIGQREVAQIFTHEDVEDSNRRLEHWVLLDGYDAGATAGVAVDSPVRGVPGLNEFREQWRAQWKSSYTYVVVDCRYYDTLPANL